MDLEVQVNNVMSGRVKIKSKDKDKKPKIDVFKVIESRFKNMNELRDLIDMDPRKGLVRIRDGAGFREVERGGCLHRNYLNYYSIEKRLRTEDDVDYRALPSPVAQQVLMMGYRNFKSFFNLLTRKAEVSILRK